jgi:serine/threonine protein phosphatase PrpC
MKSVGWSVQGMRSANNEDAFLVDAVRDVFAVADGVGSGPDGHEASRTVVETLRASLESGADIGDCIRTGVALANRKVHEMASSKVRAGMASTLVCVWHFGETIEVFHAGDSRLYRLRGERLQVLTADHSKQIERDNQWKEVVTRAVGARPSLELEHRVHEYRAGDIYALVSDGISDPLAESVIESTVGETGLSMLDRCRKLVKLAEDAGGQDDKTIILLS